MPLTEEQDRQIIELLAKGKSVSEVAEIVGTSNVTVYDRLNQNKEKIEKLKDPLYRFDFEINKRLEKILNVIDKLIDSPDEIQQLKACEMILRYAKGVKKKQEDEEPEDDSEDDWSPPPGSHGARFLEELEKDDNK